ncbi:MAG TPA: hypothetical protein VIA06_10970 [Candidatus Dormibacteraeota bacterium]|jgi:hypothetical protein|nr:hypothetical protein [Candidatus Dormibacteraeota bacterium]
MTNPPILDGDTLFARELAMFREAPHFAPHLPLGAAWLRLPAEGRRAAWQGEHPYAMALPAAILQRPPLRRFQTFAAPRVHIRGRRST